MSIENMDRAEITDVLNNPYMGWAPWAQWGPYAQPHRLVFGVITWSELEPTKGNFNWSAIETRLQFSYWGGKNVKIMFTISMDTPDSSSPTHRDIPEWLYSEINKEGTFYGSGFSPNYSNTTLISNHKRMITAMAQRYNNDSRIAFIQLGSLGHWGEFHTVYVTPGAIGYLPGISVTDQYVKHYMDTFTNKKLLMRRPFQIAKENKLGLYNEMVGDVEESERFIRYFTSGYANNGSYGIAAGTYPAMPDFWKYAPSGGEFANGDDVGYVQNSTIQQTLDFVKRSYFSYIGPCSAATEPANSSIQSNLDSMLTTLGYRFVLQAESHSASVNSGNSLSVTMQWNNKGVAPFYFNWPLELSLSNSSNNIVLKANTTEDIRTWLPGIKNTTQTLSIPSTVANGTYTLCVAILDPDTNTPGIEFAMTGKRSDGRYSIGQVIVNNSTPSNPPVITNVAANSLTTSSSLITWTTDKVSTSQVEYGKTTSYGSSSSLSSTMVTAHSVSLTGLLPSTTYYYRVKSSDAQGNLATSTNYSFTTSAINPPVISSVTAASLTTSSAVITWTTDKASTSQVEYGKTTSYGSSSALSSTMVTAHSVSLTGLSSSTTYNYRVKSSDAGGNLATSSNYSFITSNIVTPSAITIDGNASDWANIKAISAVTQSVNSFKVTNDATKLYLCIQGLGLNVKGQVFIDNNNNNSTGYKDSVWKTTGCEYLLENDTLYKYTGSGFTWSWTKIGVMSFARNNTVIEAAIPLSSLAITKTSTIKLGFILNNSQTLRLPGAGQLLVAYTCK